MCRRGREREILRVLQSSGFICCEIEREEKSQRFRWVQWEMGFMLVREKAFFASLALELESIYCLVARSYV